MYNPDYHLRISAIALLGIASICTIITLPLLALLFAASVAFVVWPSGREPLEHLYACLRFFALWSIAAVIAFGCFRTWIRAVFAKSHPNASSVLWWIIQILLFSVLAVNFYVSSDSLNPQWTLLFYLFLICALLAFSCLSARIMQNKPRRPIPTNEVLR